MDQYCPFAKKVSPRLPTKGRYEKGYPSGAVIHFTAGAYGLSELALARQKEMAYFLIDEDGGVHQGFPIDRWGSHAGVSSWHALAPGPVSNRLVGIEVDCAGKLTKNAQGKYFTWWGKKIEPEDVRWVAKFENRAEGYYHKYTANQEKALIDLILWIKANDPSGEVFNLELVVGHDEVSPGRKNDPGGSLSMAMPAFRHLLEEEWKARQSVQMQELRRLV